ncbi:selenium-dependent molybdenum cofactor biosynthesis protein YqeB [Anaeromusa acidaminophila]|uniref:selenium-dependent molybdenum cofactor biosynthesis protein YqeB n=1 Tax=Anaeromusa acidaminophila TaxID=81464 RepID=UPI00036E3A93|nr:selenium-dependent molybdenum cofactor biosynthesis protein YqeB [Anaeromusa acidaminophila]
MGNLVLVKGGGDLASGITHRLFRCGFSVVISELPQPTVIRHTVAFAEAVYQGRCKVEGVEAVLSSAAEAAAAIERGIIPVVVDAEGTLWRDLRPWALVDATLAKRNTGTYREQAELVVGVGPGFTAQQDVHVVVETNRGHDLGRVILKGAAAPNTGVPGAIGGYTQERVLRAPAAGLFRCVRAIGDTVCVGEAVAYAGEEPVCTQIAGVLRGLLHEGLQVDAGMKVADVDPRCRREHCFSISDKARAVGGGVVEALLYLGKNDGLL